MLKLLKYDFRRNRDPILGILVVLFLIQLSIGVSAKVSDWGYQTMFMLNIAAYIITGVVLLVQACRTYDYNLTSYHRRLIPLNAVYMILSPLFMYLLLLIGVSTLALLHLSLYTLLVPKEIPNHMWPIMFTGLLQMIWSACFVMIALMFSVSVARSVRIRGRVWIGIVSFFIVHNGFSLIELKLFGSNALDSSFQFQITESSFPEGGLTVSRDIYNMGPVLFEIGFAVLMVVVITRFVNRRVES